MTSEHRKAPRREVVDITRIGSWGSVVYHHKLECGHIEKRQRATRAPSLACVSCLRASEKDVELKALTRPLPPVDDYDGAAARSEVEVALVRADIARVLGVHVEAVDVVAVLDATGVLAVQSAVVFLSGADVRRLRLGIQ